ncbi:MAG: hypothetical protein R2771_06520 [Saprospiraceae bacterium]
MKNLKLISFIFMTFFIVLSGNIYSSENANPKNLTDKNSCTIIVLKNGNPVKSARVVGDVCGDISCSGQTSAEYTDQNGYATIKFSKGCKLCSVFVNGKEYSGKYLNGETYRININ